MLRKRLPVLSWLLVLIILIQACNLAMEADSSPAVQPYLEPVAFQTAQYNGPSDLSALYKKLDSIAAGPGNSIVTAIERACDCRLSEFANLGILVVREEAQVLYLPNIRSLNYFGLFGELFVLQPEDTVYFGKVADVQEAALPGVLTITIGGMGQTGAEYVIAKGGNLQYEITAEILADRSGVIYFVGGAIYPTIEEALAIVQP